MCQEQCPLLNSSKRWISSTVIWHGMNVACVRMFTQKLGLDTSLLALLCRILSVVYPSGSWCKLVSMIVFYSIRGLAILLMQYSLEVCQMREIGFL